MQLYQCHVPGVPVPCTKCTCAVSRTIWCNSLVSYILRCTSAVSETIWSTNPVSHTIRCTSAVSQTLRCTSAVSQTLRCTSPSSQILRCTSAVSQTYQFRITGVSCRVSGVPVPCLRCTTELIGTSERCGTCLVCSSPTTQTFAASSPIMASRGILSGKTSRSADTSR